MALSFSVFNKFRAVDQVSQPVNKMTKKVDRFGDRSQRAFKRADRGASRFTKTMKRLAGGMAMFLSIGALTGALTSAITAGALFEQTMVNASAKFGEGAERGTKQFKALEEAARKAGATTEFSANEAASGLNFLAMAGFNAEQSIAALPVVIDLATASNLDLARATDISTDTLGAFGLATKNATKLQENLTRVTDVMAKTVTSTNTDMEQLFETFVDAGPVAVALGASIETVATMAGRLADAGIKGSVAGTTLKNVFLRLAAATPQAQKQLDKFGVSLKDKKGNFRDVFDILEDLNGSLSKLGDVERAAVLNDIFGKIPIAGVNVLLKVGAKNLIAFRKELEAAGGASAKMAATMRDTRLNQFKTFLSALESVKISAFVAMDGVIGRVTGSMINATRALDIWINKNKFFINNVLTALIGTLTGVWGIFEIGIKIVTDANALWGGLLTPTVLGIVGAMKAWAVIQGIMNVLLTANPLGITIVALVAVSAGIKAVIDNWDFLVGQFKIGIDAIKAWFKPFVDEIMGHFDRIVNGYNKVTGIIGGAGDFISNIVGGEERGLRGVPLSARTVTNKQIREERSSNTVDVNFNNTPDNVSIAGSGGAGVTLNTGFSGGV